MRTLSALTVVVLCACEGTWVANVPPPPARASSAVATEKVFEASKTVPYAVWSSTIDHSAWVKDGQLHWLSATGRGVLPLPDGITRAVDAADGQGWALTSALELFELTPGGAQVVPSPPRPLHPSSRVHAFGRDTLITLTPFTRADDTERPAALCVWHARQWACTAYATQSGIVEPDGREPGTAETFVFHHVEGTEHVNVRFTVATGVTERLTDAAPTRALRQGDQLVREGQPPLVLTTTATQVRLDCYKPRGLAVLCGQTAHVAEVVFSEPTADGLREVAHARVDAPLSTLRRHGPFLVSFTPDHGFIISMP